MNCSFPLSNRRAAATQAALMPGGFGGTTPAKSRERLAPGGVASEEEGKMRLFTWQHVLRGMSCCIQSRTNACDQTKTHAQRPDCRLHRQNEPPSRSIFSLSRLLFPACGKPRQRKNAPSFPGSRINPWFYRGPALIARCPALPAQCPALIAPPHAAGGRSPSLNLVKASEEM